MAKVVNLLLDAQTETQWRKAENLVLVAPSRISRGASAAGRKRFLLYHLLLSLHDL